MEIKVASIELTVISFSLSFRSTKKTNAATNSIDDKILIVTNLLFRSSNSKKKMKQTATLSNIVNKFVIVLTLAFSSIKHRLRLSKTTQRIKYISRIQREILSVLILRQPTNIGMKVL